MKDQEYVPFLAEVPRSLRVRVRVVAAQRESTIGKFVIGALEAAVANAGEAPSHVE